MTLQQLKEAKDLEQKASEMARIEDELRNAAKMKLGIRLTYFEGSNAFLIGDKFIVQKMVEAGIVAAMTVRAAAENDLEKL